MTRRPAPALGAVVPLLLSLSLACEDEPIDFSGPAQGGSSGAIGGAGAGAPDGGAGAGGAIGPSGPSLSGRDAVDTYPFDYQAYQATIWASIDSRCTAARGCHAGYEDAAGGALKLHRGPDLSAAQHHENFLRLRPFLNLDAPPFSLFLLEGLNESAHAGRAVYLNRTDRDYLTVLAWIQDAAAVQKGDRGDRTAPPPSGPAPEPDPEREPIGRCGRIPDVRSSRYDFDTYVAAVQPIFNADCSSPACHGSAGGPDALTVPATGDRESCEMALNFFHVQRFLFPRNIPASTLLLKPLSPDHTGVAIFQGEGDPRYRAIYDWVAALGEVPGDAQRPATSQLDYVGYQRQVAPILTAAESLHNCADRSCHGADDPEQRGALYLAPDPAIGSPEMASNFFSVVGFVDLENPEGSPLLTWAAGQGGHRVTLRPEDEAREAVLDWIYRGRGYTRLDPVYFAERIGPIFDDPDATGSQSGTLSCATEGACHGTYSPERGPANRSRFGLIPGADTPAARLYDFNQASNFVSLTRPERSPLLLQPLREADGGVYHSGGDNWSADGQWYSWVWRWIAGLHPDDQGYVRDWLTLGPLAGGDPELDPATAQPTYGEAAGGATWQAALGAEGGDAFVDLAGGGVTYLATYLINEGPAGEIDLYFAANGYGEVWLNGAQVLSDRAAGDADPDALDLAPALPVEAGVNRLLLRLDPDGGAGGFYLRIRVRPGADQGERAAAEIFTIKLGGVEAGAVAGGRGPRAPAGALDPRYEALDEQVFREQVLPILATAGGGCSAEPNCHQNRAGGFLFQQDYQGDEALIGDILRSVRRERILRLDEPEASTLLTKPQEGNGVAHAGGKVWGVGEASYQAILAWIEAAAAGD